MENLFEILIPLLVFIFWIVSQFWGSKEEGGGGSPRPGKRGAPEEGAGDADAERRAVQEEIRRKIAERRRQLAGSEGTESPPPAPAQQTRLERGGEQYRRQQQPAQGRASAPEASQHSRMEERYGGRGHGFPEPGRESPEAKPFRIPEPTRNYEAEIESARRRAAEARAKAERVRREKPPPAPRQRPRDAYAYDTDAWDNVPLFAPGVPVREQVRAVLRDPQATRKAVLFQEILGTPVGLRRDDAMIPKWRE